MFSLLALYLAYRRQAAAAPALSIVAAGKVSAAAVPAELPLAA